MLLNTIYSASDSPSFFLFSWCCNFSTNFIILQLLWQWTKQEYSAVTQTMWTFCDKFFILSLKIRTNKKYQIAQQSDQESWNLKTSKVYSDQKWISNFEIVNLQKVFYPWPAFIAKNLSKFLAGRRPLFCWRDRLWWAKHGW